MTRDGGALPIVAGLQILNNITRRATNSRKASDLNQISTELEMPPASVHLAEFEQLKALGQSFVLQLHEHECEIQITLEGSKYLVDKDGDFESLFDEPVAEEIDRATTRVDIGQLLDLCSSMSGNLTVNLVNDPLKTECHYLENVANLSQQLLGTRWHSFAASLFKGPPLLLVGDLEDFTLELPGLRVQGVDENQEPGELPELLHERPALLIPGRYPLPSPLTVGPVVASNVSDAAHELVTAFNGVCQALVFYWLAQDVTVGTDSVSLNFSGARDVRISHLVPVRVDNVDAEIVLFSWFSSNPDTAKSESIQHAASLALADDGNLFNVAAPIYRTARSLYDLAQRGAVAEALATRRAARDAAISTAMDSAKAAREVTTKSIERTVVQIAAGTGVIVANAKDVLNSPITAALLVVLAGLLALTWFTSFRVELSAAKETINALSGDLDQYRDSLSKEDIDAIRNMEVVQKARGRIDVAKKSVAISSSAVIGILLTLSIFYLSGNSIRTNPLQVSPSSPAAPLPATVKSTNGPASSPSAINSAPAMPNPGVSASTGAPTLTSAATPSPNTT